MRARGRGERRVVGRTETGDRSRKEWGRSRGVRGTRKGERDAACVGMDQCVNGCCLTRIAEIIVSGPDGCFEERLRPRLLPKHASLPPGFLRFFVPTLRSPSKGKERKRSSFRNQHRSRFDVRCPRSRTPVGSPSVVNRLFFFFFFYGESSNSSNSSNGSRA